MSIRKPGLYPNLPIDTYHGDCCDGPSISSGGLRTIFTLSPAHYWVTSPLNPDRIEEDDKEAFILGRAAHHLLLGEDQFSTQFTMRPDKWDSWRTKDAQNWRSAEEKAGRTVLLPSQITQIRGMARSLAAHPLIEAGILNGQIEQSLIWQDETTGVWLKSRPDAIPNQSGDFADLKTTAMTGFKLDNEVINHRYDMQAALAAMGAKAVLDLDMTSFSFVFVEKKPPHCVDVVSLTTDDIASAMDDLRVAIDTFAHCLETDNWFGPSGTQSDARWVQISETAKQRAMFRRDFLRREITSEPPRAPINGGSVLAAG